MSLYNNLKNGAATGFITGAAGSTIAAIAFLNSYLDDALIPYHLTDTQILSIITVAPTTMGTVGFVGGIVCSAASDYYYGEDSI